MSSRGDRVEIESMRDRQSESDVVMVFIEGSTEQASGDYNGD